MNFKLTSQQQQLVKDAVDFYYNSSEQIFQYSGKAGTGKSVVMNAIIEELGLHVADVAPMSYIGAAAIVMRYKGLSNAKTIHSWLFTPRIVEDRERFNHYLNRYYTKLIFVDKPLPENCKLICIDEAGSVPSSLKEKLLATGRKIIACGDLNQLPPVMDDPAFLYSGKVHILDQIMRQKEESGIVYIANRILDGKPIEPGSYGNVDVVPSGTITDDMVSKSDIIICGKNDTRDHYNAKVRTLRGIDPKAKLPSHNERVICRKNNWRKSIGGISLANGLSGIVKNHPGVHSITKNGKSYKMDFKPDGFNRIFMGLKCSYDFFNASKEKKEIIRNSKYGTGGELFELGYAITTHISQGSQYKNGIYISEFLSPSIMKNLDYTGITRFSDHCTFVLRSNKFY